MLPTALYLKHIASKDYPWSFPTDETVVGIEHRNVHGIQSARVDLNEIIEGVQRGYEMPFWSMGIQRERVFSLGHGGFGGSLEAPLNGD